ncbi:MAG: hypothetical protein AMXMBFR79_12020 [Chitinophagaceae bacterium]|nr:hypothetical protein [Chitinophagales bacterium]
MERVVTLINKLKEQLDQQQDASKLLVTAQMLLAELQQNNATLNSGKVSVTMPSFAVVTDTTTNIVVEEEKIITQHQPKNTKKEGKTGWLFDPVITTIPTLAHQEIKEVFELKDTLSAEDEPSLNDKLKEEKTEVATLLNGSPIKDLKRAIGINDRYVFINELFRGDEVMYERSIKTINAFSIFAEAEYWIQRELKVKLGWEETNEIVENFNQLVKRRFS